ncbi:chorismate--pyruvate lyase family protein [Psychromonas ossibalaenae]|uniref:chorismate--pyruvate lyase family protein n=1 Tax=Psychromonas ossibalaenae TaxID=444922 RepID=UPI00036A6C7E|nr:chorismate lyase [Psychromonas ossibalaenae]
MHNHLLPIGPTAYWSAQQKPLHCPDKVLAWLYDHSSLTQKLEGLCKTFRVQIKQQITTNSRNSTLSDYFSSESQVLVREVYLYCDDIAVIFAQTEIPFSTLSEEQGKLAQIGEQSLGKFLFQDPTMVRGSIETAEFCKNSAVHQLSDSLEQSCGHSLWARRSLFYVKNKPLLVSEVFLPASGIYST